MTTFDKPAQSIDQHLDTLRQRGLAILDEARARHYLGNISYYRLSAYTRPFYRPGQTDHIFLDGTSFDDVLHLYVFDRELRLLLLDAIERLEVALRAQLTNTLAEHHGPHSYLDATLFDTRYDHGWLINRLDNEAKAREVETFLAHYRSKYTAAPPQPPIWMAVELLTFKEVSILFAHLRQAKDTQRIEVHFGWKFPLLKSWFRSLSDLRNVCAHHARVWNRKLSLKMQIPGKKPAGLSAQFNPAQDRRLYNTLTMLAYLMSVISPASTWSQRLKALIHATPQIAVADMGFPSDWKQRAIWQETTP